MQRFTVKTYMHMHDVKLRQWIWRETIYYALYACKMVETNFPDISYKIHELKAIKFKINGNLQVQQTYKKNVCSFFPFCKYEISKKILKNLKKWKFSYTLNAKIINFN